MNKKGDLRIWWIPQVPMKPFYFPVKDVATGAAMLKCLALYDAFQFDNKIKPDYCNAGGLMVYDPECPDEETGDCWVEWCDEETGEENPEKFLKNQGIEV